MVNLKKLVKSFYYAGKGLAYLFNAEQNFRIEVFGSFSVLFALFYFNVGWIKIFFIGILFMLILSFEIINTIFEEITDYFVEERVRRESAEKAYQIDLVQDELIGRIKDMAAALVLLASVFSVLIAIAILLAI